MTEATAVKAKREPTGGSVNLAKRHLEMAREIAKARSSNIRSITEGAIRSEYIRKFGKAAYEERYGTE